MASETWSLHSSFRTWELLLLTAPSSGGSAEGRREEYWGQSCQLTFRFRRLIRQGPRASSRQRGGAVE